MKFIAIMALSSKGTSPASSCIVGKVGVTRFHWSTRWLALDIRGSEP